MKEEDVRKYLSMSDEEHRNNIRRAAENLKGIIRPTALIRSDYYSREFGCDIYIKPENLQVTGSFKIRGAYNKISNLTKEEAANGIIASSAGNHAQGVAFSAQKKGIKSTIVMPNVTPLLKVNATKAYGSDVVIYGDVYDDAYAKAMELASEKGYTFVHPFDDYDVLCGQGTIGLEILEALEDVDEILVPIGGGGLISGIALAVKTVRPDIKVIGVSPVGSMAMKISLEERHVTRLSSVKTSAEGVAVRQPGDLTFALAGKYVDEIITITEKDIMEAVLVVLEKHKLIAETAGVVPLAGVKKRAKPGRKIVCLMSGGNIDVNILARIIDRGLMKGGRKIFCATMMIDRPGTLSKLLLLIAEIGANIIQITHSRNKQDIKMGYANAVLEMETTDEQQEEKIKKVLAENGYLAKIY